MKTYIRIALAGFVLLPISAKAQLDNRTCQDAPRCKGPCTDLPGGGRECYAGIVPFDPIDKMIIYNISPAQQEKIKEIMKSPSLAKSPGPGK